MKRLRALWCTAFHRASWFHGMSCTRCLRCKRIWVSRVFVIPGDGERSLVEREPPRLRRVQ